MTRLQGWLLILIIAFVAGWYIGGDLIDMPSATERGLESHRELMERIR